MFSSCRDSLEFFDSGRVIRTFRGLSRRKRSPSHRQTTNEKVLGEGEDGYYDDQEYVDYYYYDGRRKREPYFYQRRKKRRQQDRIVIQGRNQVAGAIFQSDAAGNAAGFSTQFVQGAAGEISVVLITFLLHKAFLEELKEWGAGEVAFRKFASETSGLQPLSQGFSDKRVERTPGLFNPCPSRSEIEYSIFSMCLF